MRYWGLGEEEKGSQGGREGTKGNGPKNFCDCIIAAIIK